MPQFERQLAGVAHRAFALLLDSSKRELMLLLFACMHAGPQT